MVPREDDASDHVLELLKPYTTENGGPLEVERVHFTPGRGNVIIKYPGKTTARSSSLVICEHTKSFYRFTKHPHPSVQKNISRSASPTLLVRAGNSCFHCLVASGTSSTILPISMVAWRCPGSVVRCRWDLDPFFHSHSTPSCQE